MVEAAADAQKMMMESFRKMLQEEITKNNVAGGTMIDAKLAPILEQIETLGFKAADIERMTTEVLDHTMSLERRLKAGEFNTSSSSAAARHIPTFTRVTKCEYDLATDHGMTDVA